MDEKEIIKSLAEVEQRAKSNTRRIDRLEERQDNLEKLTETVAKMQAELGHATSMITETRDAVKELQAKPAKRWDALIAAIVSAIVGLAVGLLFHGA